MSRKRKPVLQLGDSSKLHKYGYSKEFHTKDKKGKSALTALVGNYSDSGGDDTADDGEEPNPVVHVSIPDAAAQSSALGPSSVGTPDAVTPERVEKPQDIDDELKNFLSEIEAIPMPADIAGEQARNGPGAVDTASEQNSSKVVAPNPGDEDQHASVGNGPEIPADGSSGKGSVSSAGKSKSRYSMFVKGESEFVHSPPPPPPQETKTADVPGVEEADGEALEEDIPEEPTSAWQLVQDEGSQYYYYWNTVTNEVTWEIPSEYTQFLLLHREFSDKLARLPPQQLQAYQERKAREAAALTAASAHQSGGVDAAGDSTQEQAVVYGPAARASPTLGTDSAKPSVSSSHHHHQKKHKKEKKKRRHKRRHSDSESSGGESGKEDSTAREIGPQLPKKLEGSTTTTTITATTQVSSSSGNTAGGPQLMSIVPYLSDADDDSEDEEKTDSPSAPSKTDDLPLPETKLAGVASPVDNSDSGDSDTFAGSEPKPSAKSEGKCDLAKKPEEVIGEPEDSQNKSIVDEASLAAKTVVENASHEHKPAKVLEKKAKKVKKEVIDMFAEDFPLVKEDAVSPASGMDHNSKDGDEPMEEEVVTPKENKDAVKSKTQDATDSSQSKAISSPTVTTKSTSSKSSSSRSSKASTDASKEKSKEKKKDAFKPLNIVGYGSDDEEEKPTGGEEAKDKPVKVRKEEDVPEASKLPSSSSLSSSGSKKKKKEKRRHRHENKEEKEEKVEGEGGVLSNIMTSGLGKDVMARVSETLDQEISDIVIQTVSQSPGETPPPAKPSSKRGAAERDENKASEGSLTSGAEKTEKKSKTRRDNHSKVGVERSKVDKKPEPEDQLTSEKFAKLLAEQEKIAAGNSKPEPEAKEQVAKDDSNDDDDIDFEDLDDLDRALEVALERKKVELAKYEEGERKQQESVQTSNGQPEPEEAVLSNKDAEALLEEEEKLKAEVKDIAELALSKLEFLDISTDNLSRLQVLFIELQTRLHDWNAGGLSSRYFQEQLCVAQGLLEQYELSAVPQGWACQWDRGNNRYYYRNLATDRIQWDYPDEDDSRGQGKEPERRASADSKTVVEKKTSSSSSKRDKSRERESVARGGSVEDKDAARKKGSSSSSRHRKREERDKDKGSKHDKRREGGSSSHRYRRKRRRRRDHSSSSSSSDSSDDEDNKNSVPKDTGKSGGSSSSRRHHRHHKSSGGGGASKKKKKRRGDQQQHPSRSPSVEMVEVRGSPGVEVVPASGDEGSGKESCDKTSPGVTVMEASPTGSSAVSTPVLDGETAAARSAAPPPPPPPPPATESIDGEPLGKNGDVNHGVSDGDADVDGVSLEENRVSKKGEGEEEEEEGEIGEDDEEEEGEKAKAEIAKPAVIYKPPQIVVPPQMVAAARQPELYTAAPSVSSQPSSLQAPPTAGSGVVPAAQGQGSHGGLASEGMSTEAADEARKKKKEKKSSSSAGLLMKKKHMSSMVQKWQKVKKEVEKEDRAKEMRQAAIRRKIEELK